MSPESFEINRNPWHASVGTRALAAAAATTVTGSGSMHLQVTTLNETSAHTRTTAVRRRGTTNSAGGLDDTVISSFFWQLEESQQVHFDAKFCCDLR